jgi:hypothetical protein
MVLPRSVIDPADSGVEMPAAKVTDPYLLDLVKGQLVDNIVADLELTTESSPPTFGEANKCMSVLVRFPIFSDGRGLTLGRRLRTELGFAGKLIAGGHIIPDQADFLRRCGFSHAWIKPGQLDQWQTALASIKIRFQHTPCSPRSRV